MTSWPSALINILLGSTSAAYLGELNWGNHSKKESPLPTGKLGEGKQAMFHRERVSEAQPLAETGEGHVGGNRQRNTQGKTKLGGVKPPAGKSPTLPVSPVTPRHQVHSGAT